MTRPGLMAAMAATCAMLAGATQAQEPFYANKDLRVLINYGAGGPTDIEGRLFGTHIGRHIEGAPGVTVSNMDGAGGMVGNNFLATGAPKDGSVLGYMTGAAWRSVFSPEMFEAPLTDFEFVAFQPGTTFYFMRTDVPPGISGPADLMKASGFVAGGLNANNSKDLTIRLVLDMLGLEYEYVTGYPGSGRARAALEQGEIEFYSESAPSYFGVIEPTMVAEGTLAPMWYDPGILANGEIYTPSQAANTDVKAFDVVYEELKGEPPSGPLWDAYSTILRVNAGLQRIIAFPPGTPEAAVTALREAVARLNDDPEFAEDAMRTIGFVPRYMTGPDTNEEVRASLSVDPEIKAFIEDYIRQAGR